jgi:hypothetical protein
MGEQDSLAQRFETRRTHMRAVAYRMLGSISEAEDALAAPRAHVVLRDRVAGPGTAPVSPLPFNSASR